MADLRQVDWTEVFQSQDVDMAAKAFTGLFRNVLNKHAPCIIYQQRKHYVPWLTDQKLELMRERDESKASALKLALEGSDSSEAWTKYRKIKIQFTTGENMRRRILNLRK